MSPAARLRTILGVAAVMVAAGGVFMITRSDGPGGGTVDERPAVVPPLTVPSAQAALPDMPPSPSPAGGPHDRMPPIRAIPADPSAPVRPGGTAHVLDARPGRLPPLERLLAGSGVATLAEARGASDPQVALAAYDRYLAAHPDGALREQALAGQAASFEALGQRPQAAAAWRALLDAYPGSLNAPEARRRLSALGQ